MPTDPQATLDDAPDPSEDTQADTSEDTAEDTQGSTVDWESRYKELQRRATKAERERDQYRNQLEASAADDDDEDEGDDEPAGDAAPVQSRNADRLERDSWTLAEQLYGEAALTAYVPAARLLNRAQTPADAVAAFEAYHEARLKGAKPAAAAAAAQAPGDQPEQPRVQSNRSDASPRTTDDLDARESTAAAKGDLRGVLAARIERTLRG